MDQADLCFNILMPSRLWEIFWNDFCCVHNIYNVSWKCNEYDMCMFYAHTSSHHCRKILLCHKNITHWPSDCLRERVQCAIIHTEIHQVGESLVVMSKSCWFKFDYSFYPSIPLHRSYIAKVLV